MFEKEIAKSKYSTARIRRDKVRKILESGKFAKVVCNYSYTDDYLYDAQNNFGKGECSREWAMELVNKLKRPSVYCYLNKSEPNRVHIIIHSNLSYSLYITEPEKEKKSEAGA